MLNSVRPDALLRNAETTFRAFNRDKNLASADRTQLKILYLQRVLGRKTSVDDSGSVESRFGGKLMNAKDLEALTGIDKKTIYNYVTRGIIPHVLIESNVRFRENEIKDWLERHTHRPRTMKQHTKNGRSTKRPRR